MAASTAITAAGSEELLKKAAADLMQNQALQMELTGMTGDVLSQLNIADPFDEAIGEAKKEGMLKDMSGADIKKTIAAIGAFGDAGGSGAPSSKAGHLAASTTKGAKKLADLAASSPESLAFVGAAAPKMKAQSRKSKRRFSVGG